MAQSDMNTTLLETLETTEEGVRACLSRIRADLMQWGYGADTCGTLEIVLAEALNNVVEHAHESDGIGVAHVALTRHTDKIEVEIRDHGIPLPDTRIPAAALPSIDVDICDLPEGGFGWFMIHSLATEVRYARVGQSNHLSLQLSVGV